MDMRARPPADLLSRALGEALAAAWSFLPHDVQHRIFEDAIARHGENIRAPLAIHLHKKHPRTHAAMKARAVLEPDSLGG
jgi:hypothetical protein